MPDAEGVITRIVGPVVVARGLARPAMYDVVRVGRARLFGEVVRLEGGDATIQVYEDTSGLRTGEPVRSTGGPLKIELGPGLLGMVYDGIQRPLAELAKLEGPCIGRGASVFALDRKRPWEFVPKVSKGEKLMAGDILGTVQETPSLVHKILVPPGMGGVVGGIQAGRFTVEDQVAEIHNAAASQVHQISLMQQWPVRERRPFARRLTPVKPLITGQRVIDSFFPIARGGAAIIPGGFGTGKTILEQLLAKWVDVDVVIYIGCGERGNEIAEVIEEFTHLIDPRTGTPLQNRTVLIVNTSNMPVAAREASIYTGLTIAEYYRDMGYDAALMADSTSRWGEALREVSGRLEELPGEEGYPAYLATRLADFYERAGYVQLLGSDERKGSVGLISAVSPPGADFSEPITQGSLRLAGAFWALDHDLSRRRHFPAINWVRSYSLFDLGEWFGEHIAPDWKQKTGQAMALLQRESELLEIVQIIGAETLPEAEKAILLIAQILREDFLQQYAYHPVDAFCPPEKQYLMLSGILTYYELLCNALQQGVALDRAIAIPEILEISRMKEWAMPEARQQIRNLVEQLEKAFAELKEIKEADK